LDGNPRVWCGAIDIGAFEFFATPTKITSQPRDIRTVLGAQFVILSVEAEGVDLHYVWTQNYDSDWLRYTQTFNLWGTWQDTGVYQVIVYGVCDNDTSRKVTVKYDDWWLESGGECPNEESWQKVVFDENYSYNVAWEFPVGNIGETRYYRVTITDSESRFVEKDSFYIKYPLIEILNHSIANPDNVTCNNGLIRVNIDNPNNYEFYWKYNDEILGDERTLYDLSIGNYTLFIERKDFRFCEGDTFNFSITECDYKFRLRNAYLSPNGDDINDFLWIYDIEHFPNNTVTVINSYGETIFSAKNYKNDKDVAWDGRNRRGNLVPDGVYYYVVEIKGMKTMAGWVMVKISD
jgi:gliding motility-associated-like protein